MVKKLLCLVVLVLVVLGAFVEPLKAQERYGIPEQIDFQTETLSISFLIKAPLDEGIKFSLLQYPDEVIIAPTGGTLASGESVEVRVTLKRNDFLPGYYEGEIIFKIEKSNGGIDNVSLKFTGIVKPSPYPLIEPLSLDFGTTDLEKIIRIRNIGGKPVEPLTFRIIETPSWISPNLTNGVVNDLVGKEVTFTANRNLINPGLNTGRIVIETNSLEVPQKIITCSIIGQPIQNPQLEAFPLVLDFGNSLTDLQLVIKNKGGGFLTGRIFINLDCQWQSAIYISQLIFGPLGANQQTTVLIKVSRTGLSYGTYLTYLNIVSNGGNLNIPLKFFVEKPPQPLLYFSPTFLNLDIAKEGYLEIFNVGEKNSVLSWSINQTTIPFGVEFSSVRGTILAGESERVRVKVNANILPPGQYKQDILIESNGGKGYLTLYYQIIAESKIKISTTNLIFGSDKDKLTFTIENLYVSNYQKSLEIKFLSVPYWLTLSYPKSTVLPGEKIEVEANFLRDILDSGNYSALIKIQTNDPTNPIVTLNCSAVVLNPLLEVKPLDLDFKTDLKELTVTVRNAGQGILKVKVKSLDKWLVPVAEEFSLKRETKEIKVIAQRNLISGYGGFKGNIMVISNGGSALINAYIEIPEPKPNLYLEITEFDFQTDKDKVQFVISNTGEKNSIMKWKVKFISNELSISESEGELLKDQYKLLTVFLNRAALPIGEWTGKIIFEANSEEKTVIFKARKLSPPLIQAEPESVLVDVRISRFFEISISNKGEEPLVIEKIETPPEIEVLETVGTSDKKVKFKVNILKFGETRTKIKIISNGGTKEIEVIIKNPLELQFFIDRDFYFKNGEMFFIESPPFIKEGRTFLPLRSVAESLNLQVKWDPVFEIIKISDGDFEMVLQLGKKVAFLNNQPVLLEIPPFTINGRTMVPLRFIAESFGFEVKWVPPSQEIVLLK